MARYPIPEAPIPSSVIASFHYNAAHATLTIVFVTGRVYEYFAVPAKVATDLQNAPSKGAFFNAQIRNRYPFREITVGAG